jgi:hypothetical protein
MREPGAGSRKPEKPEAGSRKREKPGALCRRLVRDVTSRRRDARLLIGW